MSLTSILILSGLSVLAYVTAVWLLSLRLRNASIIDVCWGLGFVLLAMLYFALADGYLERKLLILTLVSLWGLRLTFYLLWRSWGEPEDFRHSQWRDADGSRFWWTSFIRIFLLQGSAIWIISMPVLAAESATSPDHVAILDVGGAVLWGIGFFFETAGDWQLVRFKSNPDNLGKVMRRGLWSLTRHPNYFGDALVWWGFFVIAAGTTDGYVTVFAPLFMTLILLRFSGVGLMEPHLQETRPEYARYVFETSAFLPWIPKRHEPGSNP